MVYNYSSDKQHASYYCKYLTYVISFLYITIVESNIIY